MDGTPMDGTGIAPAPGAEGQGPAAGGPEDDVVREAAAGEREPAEAVGEAGGLLAAIRDENTALLARLRAELVASEPAVDAATVTGTTLAELEASFAAARDTVRRVRESLRREEAATIPAGAPGRLSQLPATPLEKIRAGIAALEAPRG